jgi:hypothetical protein
MAKQQNLFGSIKADENRFRIAGSISGDLRAMLEKNDTVQIVVTAQVKRVQFDFHEDDQIVRTYVLKADTVKALDGEDAPTD